MGSTQHLKSTHGSGYVLEVNVEPSTADVFDEDAVATQRKRVDGEICGRLFVNAKCTEHFGQHCVYQVPQTSVKKLSDVFSALEQSNVALWFSHHHQSSSSSSSSLGVNRIHIWISGGFGGSSWIQIQDLS